MDYPAKQQLFRHILSAYLHHAEYLMEMGFHLRKWWYHSDSAYHPVDDSVFFCYCLGHQQIALLTLYYRL